MEGGREGRNVPLAVSRQTPTPPGVMSGAFNPYFMAFVLEFVHFPAKFTFCRIVWQIWMRLMGLMAISTLIKFLPRVTALPFRIAAREPSMAAGEQMQKRGKR